MLGYWNLKEETAKAVKDGWLHTGDIGEFDKNKYLKITDRKKDIIVNLGGDNISPSKIENILCLNEFIKQSRQIGVGNLNTYLVEFHKRTSLPISTYILTFIAVCLAAKKRRGGMGVNLAIGITLMFVYVFFLKIVEVLGAGAETNALIMVWLPNIFFGGLAVYLYLRNAKN